MTSERSGKLVQILDFNAVSPDALVDDWWQWALIGVVIASGSIGLIAGLWYVYGLIRTSRKVSVAGVEHNASFS
jgi:hypothetical protein